MSQTPVEAPTVRKLAKNVDSMHEETNLSHLSSSSKKNSNYLFENIDIKLLKADEEFIKKVYK